VGAGHEPDFDVQGTDLGGRPAIRPDTLLQDHATDQLLLQVQQEVGHLLHPVGVALGQLLGDLLDHLLSLFLPAELVGVAQGHLQPPFRGLPDLPGQLRVRGGQGHFPLRLARAGGQVPQGRHHLPALLVGQLQGLQHAVLGHLVGPALHHDDGVLAGRHHQVQLALVLDLLQGGVHHELAVHQPDPHAADGTCPRDVGKAQGRGSSHHRGHVRRVHLVRGQGGGDDLHVVAEPLGEQGPDGPVHEAGGQDGLLPRPALPLEKAARDLPRGVQALLEVAGEGEEVNSLARLVRARGGHQHHGVAVPDGHRGVGLLGQLTGLDDPFLAPDLEAHAPDVGYTPLHFHVPLLLRPRRVAGAAAGGGDRSPGTTLPRECASR
jgi:hypothetical protein